MNAFSFTLHVRCPDAAAIGAGQEIKRQGRWIQELAAFPFCFVFINTNAGSSTKPIKLRATGMSLCERHQSKRGGHPERGVTLIDSAYHLVQRQRREMEWMPIRKLVGYGHSAP